MKRYAFLCRCARPLLLGVLALPFATSRASAQTLPTTPVAVESTDSHSIRVRVSGAAVQTGRVQVLSLGSGQVLFDESYHAAAYGHRFDFRNLQPGLYALLLQNGATRYRYTLRVQAGPAGTAVALRTLKARLPKAALAAAL